MATYRLTVVDNSRLFREGLKRLLPKGHFIFYNDCSFCDFSNIDSSSLINHSDFVLIEWRLDSQHIEQLRPIFSNCTSTKIIALSDNFRERDLLAALSMGFHGFLLKDISADALINSLLLVRLGEIVFPSALARYLITAWDEQDATKPDSASNAAATLSIRERQILNGLVLGKSNKAIAGDLDLAIGTVKVHLKNLLRKIRAHNRTQAAIWAMNNGLDDGELKAMTKADSDWTRNQPERPRPTTSRPRLNLVRSHGAAV